MKPEQRQPITDAVLGWHDVIQNPADVDIPRELEDPLPIIPLHTNGMQCRREPNCLYIGTHIRSMRKHWQQVHGWTQQGRQGRVGAAEHAVGAAEFQLSFRTVAWQQVFPTRKNSHLVHIRSCDPEPDEPRLPSTEYEQIAAEIKARAVDDEKQATCPTAESETPHDANPWLRMTRWARYLAGVHLQDLLDVVTPPDPDAIDAVSQATRRVWDTMAQLARRSQQTVQHCGNGIRMAAASTMPSQTPYQPLRAYMDEKSIQEHVRPWQQILLFVIRTQTDWSWQEKTPRYMMTTRQQRTWQRLWQLAREPADDRTGDPSEEPRASRGSPDPMAPDVDLDRLERFLMTPLETACLEFCIELLNQKTKVHEYESPLVCAMAVLGRGEQGWRDPTSYPPIISRVLKVARFLVVQKALWLDPQHQEIIQMWAATAEEGSWTGDAADDDLAMILDDEGYASSPEPSSVPPSSLPSRRPAMPSSAPPGSALGRIRSRMPFQAGVDWMVQRFMVRGQHGPVEVLLDWRTFGLKIHYNTTAPGHVTWMGEDRLLYKEMDFTMGQFRGFVHGVVGAARTLMGSLLCQSDHGQWPAIPWDRLFDNPTEGGAGWSFLQDRRTPWPVTGGTWLVDRLGVEPAMARAFTTQGAVSPTKLQKYFQQVARFKEKLAVAVHLTGGAPARAPELLSIQHVNTETNSRRNIFIEDGMVVFVTTYHKGFHASNDIKIIHRYLPREVGELVVWYLWLVLPFVRQLAVTWRQLTSPSADPRHIRPPREPPAHRSPYLWGPDVGTGREWSSERLREVLKRESKTSIGAQHPLNIANYRDIAIGISRRFLRPSSAFPNNVQAEQEQERAALAADDDPDEIGNIADEQAGHSPHVAGIMYGRESTELAGSTLTWRLRFRASSTDWHRFLGFPDRASPVLGKRANPWEEQAVDHQEQRRQQLAAQNMAQVLQRMTGRPELQLRGVQAPALKAIQDGASPVVAIMPTGGGKSMLFMLPAYAAPGGCTVVVVPLLSLRADLTTRCQALGISCVAWESRRPPDEAAIVLVTPESTENPDFHTFLNRQRQLRRLDRIVVDECHVILNEQKDFRPAMARLGRLVSAQTQMVFLTATLPPTEEDRFLQRIQHPRHEVGIYRARTSRRNVAYRVVRPLLPRGVPREPHQWLAQPEVLQFLHRRICQARDGRVIVYAKIKSQVDAVSRELGCEAYHSTVLDRTGILQQFQRGHTRVIAATSALGMGIDIPDIRCVIHLGRPRTLLDYGQESGRAGRDGQPSEAIIIHPQGWEDPDPWINRVSDDDFERVQTYMEVVEGVGCRRYVLDQYLDGTVNRYTRQQCQDMDPGELPCDACNADWLDHDRTPTPASEPDVDMAPRA
jgi:superfamily II DNA or RNA helicase